MPDYDAELAKRIRARDPEALREVVTSYLPQILRAARGAGLSLQSAEDVTQATFTTFLERATEFEGRSHVRTWLFGILYKKISEARRQILRDEPLDDIEDVFGQRFGSEGSWLRPPRSADDQVYDSQVREGIEDCLETLPDKQRVAFVLRDAEGLTTDEICKILEVNATNFGVLLYRGRNRLRECLERKGIKR